MASPLRPAPASNDPGDARLRAARAVAMVTDQGRTLDAALEDALGGSAAAGRERALVRELSFGTLRWYHRLAERATRNLHKPIKPRDRDLWALMLVGLYQLEFTRMPPHAAVDSSVRAAKLLGKPWAAGLLNAVLRSAQRQNWPPPDLPAPVQWAHPDWLYQAIADDWPQYLQAIMSANNTRPPMILRVNLARISRDDYLVQLQAAGIAAQSEPDSPAALTLASPLAVDGLPGFAAGLVSVQDISAQQVAALVGAQAGDRVLDACAAPGGKCAHLLECSAGITLDAVDIDPQRVMLLQGTLDRLQLAARVICADAAQADAWWDGQAYQRILIDAPCSGSGVISRHPDIKHLRRPQDIAGFAAQQGRLLDALWPLLDPQGVMVYVTCSVLTSENDAVIAAFLNRTAGVSVEPVAGRVPGVETEFGCQALPGVHSGDGFYYARLRHKA